VTLLLAAAVLTGCIVTSTNSGLSKGRPAPNIHGFDADGQSFQLSDYRGKVVLLDFWASYCGPCRSMFAHERSLVQKYEGKPFALLGVNTDNTREQLLHEQQANQLNWRSWLDAPNGAISTQWKVEGLPTLFLIDHKGLIRWESVGVPNLKEMDALIEQLVQEAEAS
jgi:thiol-disulfide isomerase/thioredoxin